MLTNCECILLAHDESQLLVHDGLFERSTSLHHRQLLQAYYLDDMFLQPKLFQGIVFAELTTYLYLNCKY